MGITPNTRLGKLQFYEAHITPWSNNAVAIGLDVGDVTSLAGLTGAARLAYNAHLAAQQAAKSATQNFYDAIAAMHGGPNAGSDMIDTIKNFAQATDDPNVYTLAEIPPPAPPGTVPPPGTPYDFRVALLQNGNVELKWKSNNPEGAPGTVYEIKRSDDGGPFNYIDTAGKKVFTDTTIPQGVGPMTYEITAIRSELRGNPAQFNVQLGSPGNVPNTTTETTGGELGIAA